MNRKSIIFDVDGTAIDSPSQKLPTEQLKQAIKSVRAKYHVSSATGRTWSFAKPVLQALELMDPCIISAGTQICDPRTGEILWQKNIDPSALDRVLAVIREYPLWKIHHNDQSEDDYFNGGMFLKDFASTEPVYFFEQSFVPPRAAQEIYERLRSIPEIACVMVTAQKPDTKDLHIVNSGATKEHAVAQLLKILGLEKSDTIGIGDGHNDIHLFNAVGRKIAMGNAIAELKDASDEVIGSVTEDGLAVYLKSL